MGIRWSCSAILAALALAGCTEPTEPAVPESPPPELSETQGVPSAAAAAGESRSAYFGDLHVHTFYSLDAFIFGTRATPDDAYRYAKGEAIRHPAGFEVQLDRPLDFYAVTDHAVFLGHPAAWADGTASTADHPAARELVAAASIEERAAAFRSLATALTGDSRDALFDPAVIRAAWQEIQAAAERHNDPGAFTTFIGYEYTSAPQQQNLHRNVIFRGSQGPEVPFSRQDSQNPEDLWRWMDALRDRGVEALAIPHNSNASNGQMFAREDWAGAPLDAAYAERRMRNEPLVEITQVKGTSETHPALSPNDEWADFEIMPYRIASRLDSRPSGSYLREAWMNGIAMETDGGFNPFRFGVVGASDTHTGAAPVDEEAFFSKAGLMDATPQRRGSVPLDEPGADEEPRYRDVYYPTWGASGLTGVWAAANTRAALYDALRRRETFATSGPRLVIRLFGGFGLPDGLHLAPDMARTAYVHGVPMGGDLLPPEESGSAPRFVVAAMRDPLGAPLQRLQIVKAWVEDGEPRERIHDVACSDGLSPDPATRRCADNGARVRLETCEITAGVGADQLAATWDDPDFDPGQEAFYYARVLENPTCRWSTWDAVRAGVAPRSDLPAIIQERAWSSPIWYHGSSL